MKVDDTIFKSHQKVFSVQLSFLVTMNYYFFRLFSSFTHHHIIVVVVHDITRSSSVTIIL